MSKRRAIVLQHVPFEGPAKLGEMLEERGYSIDLRRLDRGEAVPQRLEAGELLVVMGGPMGIGDLDDPAFPFLREEVELIRACIADDAAVLGVCLGAQLLAHAAGARVVQMRGEDGSRRFEVGWAPVVMHPERETMPILRGLGPETMVLHWHGDRFDLPEGARRLASTEFCPTQAFQLKRRMFGLQYHVEVERENVEDFLREDSAFVELARGKNGVEEVRRETELHFEASRSSRDLLLSNLLDAMIAP